MPCISSLRFVCTSISSLYLSSGASIMLRSLNVSVSTSKVWPVTWVQNEANYSYYHHQAADDLISAAAVHLWPCFTNLSYSPPVAGHHSFVSHELQQGAALAEFINRFLQVQEGLPLLQSARQFATPGSSQGITNS